MKLFSIQKLYESMKTEKSKGKDKELKLEQKRQYFFNFPVGVTGKSKFIDV